MAVMLVKRMKIPMAYINTTLTQTLAHEENTESVKLSIHKKLM